MAASPWGEMGRHSCCYKEKIRKGLWSPEEDQKLYNHISKFGVGCWSSVPKLAGNYIIMLLLAQKILISMSNCCELTVAIWTQVCRDVGRAVG